MSLQVPSLNQSIVIGLGELLWDGFGSTRRPGGATANVAYHAGQLGARGVVVSRVGNDPLGDELVAFLQDRELDTRYVQRDRKHPTGTVTVHDEAQGPPRFTVHENVAWDHLAFDDALAELAASAAAVCFGTLAQRAPQSREAIEKMVDACRLALRVFDINLRPPWHDAKTIEAALGRSQVVKLNDEEVPQVAQALGFTMSDDLGVARALLENYALDCAVVTRGARGCLAVSHSEQIDVPGRAVVVADTVGSGDAFTAAFVCGLLQSWPLARTARFANQVGGLVAGRAGAMPMLREEYAALLDQDAGPVA